MNNEQPSNLLSATDYQWYQMIASTLWGMGKPSKEPPSLAVSIPSLRSAFYLLIEKLVVATQVSGQLSLTLTPNTLLNELTLSQIHQALPCLFDCVDLVDAKNHTSAKPIVIMSSYSHDGDENKLNYDVLLNQTYNQLLSCFQFIKEKTRKKIPPFNELSKQINWQISSDLSYSTEQQLAALTLAFLPFGLLSGGAGTGKSTTLIKIISIILAHKAQTKVLLTAPTGKATHRLNELISHASSNSSKADSQTKSLLATVQVETLHKALGVNQTRANYHNYKNPINYDVVIIDESSMISLSLFTQLKASLLPHTRLILVGDANQLPAIESISLFNFLCKSPVTFSHQFINHLPDHLSSITQPKCVEYPRLLSDSLYILSQVKRYREQSVIGDLANAILHHDYAYLTRLSKPILQDITDVELVASHLKESFTKTKNLINTIKNTITLCATKKGSFGSLSINESIDEHLRAKQNKLYQNLWYEGRPVIIEKNDYHINVFNGDIGYCKIIDNHVHILFSDQRILSLTELNNTQYSLAYAISIHKSQGSEYQHVNIVLPTETANYSQTMISPALLYTAITRAKQSFCLYTNAYDLEKKLSHSEANSEPLLFNQFIQHYS